MGLGEGTGYGFDPRFQSARYVCALMCAYLGGYVCHHTLYQLTLIQCLHVRLSLSFSLFLSFSLSLSLSLDISILARVHRFSVSDVPMFVLPR
jgi:hypothetical protein